MENQNDVSKDRANKLSSIILVGHPNSGKKSSIEKLIQIVNPNKPLEDDQGRFIGHDKKGHRVFITTCCRTEAEIDLTIKILNKELDRDGSYCTFITSGDFSSQIFGHLIDSLPSQIVQIVKHRGPYSPKTFDKNEDAAELPYKQDCDEANQKTAEILKGLIPPPMRK